MNAIIKKAGTNDIETIRTLTYKIWPLTYTAMVGREQVDYMLHLIYSHASLKNQIENLQHHFIIIYEDDNPLGFASYSVKSEKEPNIFRLNKLYVLTHQHGKGLGKQLLDYIITELKNYNATELELNANRQNPAISFYRKMGFDIKSSEDIDIGNGYFMNDYVMGLKLNNSTTSHTL